MVKITKEAALLYHSQGKPGKIEVIPRGYSHQTISDTARLVIGILSGSSRAMS